MVVEVMSKNNPSTNLRDLIDICVKDWKPESVTRKHRTRAKNIRFPRDATDGQSIQ